MKLIHVFYIFSLMTVSSVSLSNTKLKPKDTEQWLPVPPTVTLSQVPSDAVVLFDGGDLNAWVGPKGTPPSWVVENGTVTIAPGKGGISTRQNFCDIQLHLEWQSPVKIDGKSGQALGNSGVFLPGGYEVQILDSYKNRTYSNGQAGSIYKQSPPLVNAIKPTGEWNSYDIIFTAPRFLDSGAPVLHNGVLVQNHFQLQGATIFRGLPKYKAHGCAPIHLQEHKDEVKFKNIWVREL